MQILQVIKRHGYRLEDVANALGITKGSLSATINGSPNVKKLIEIALVIGCSPAEFFDDWYDNEGKEQQRPAEQGRPSPAPSLSGRGVDTTEPQDNLRPSLQQAIICPHCGHAMVMNVVSEEV